MSKYPLERKPPWLRFKIAGGEGYVATKSLVRKSKLNTVCESAQCPNLAECWERRTATVMILGDICTRSCGFCAVKTGRPLSVDWGEPERVAQAIKSMELKHVVITSVARDELPDGGAEVWAETILRTRQAAKETKIEVLIPDFQGREKDIDVVLNAKPDILNHNVETVERLHPQVRSSARYERSLNLLSYSKKCGFLTKTGLMLGIGEEKKEIEKTLEDLVKISVDILTLGQYMRPTQKHLPVKRWVEPKEFVFWKEFALSLGFRIVESGSFVRSSYHADEQSKILLCD